MKTTIATTKEQSDRLLRCGVSVDTADMCYDSGTLSLMKYHDAICERDSRGENYEVVPAWSLSALLELLPKFIPDAGGDFSYALKIQPCNLPGWTVCYYAYSLDKGKGYHRSEDVIEACVQLIEWLTANGYKLHDPDCLCREKGGENDC